MFHVKHSLEIGSIIRLIVV